MTNVLIDSYEKSTIVYEVPTPCNIKVDLKQDIKSDNDPIVLRVHDEIVNGKYNLVNIKIYYIQLVYF